MLQTFLPPLCFYRQTRRSLLHQPTGQNSSRWASELRTIPVRPQETTCESLLPYRCGQRQTSKTLGRSIGAVVQVFDITTLYPKIEFWQIQEPAFDIWLFYPSNNPYDPGLFQLLNENYYMPILGQHYFIEKDGKLSPVWDFRSTTGNPNDIIVAKEGGDFPSPAGYPNVDWLELTHVSGGLADKVFRVYTVGGDPPSSVSISRSAIVLRD